VEHVLGIGGYFIRAADPAVLGAWYRDCLGLDADDNGLWHQADGADGLRSGVPVRLGP
jgi:hypothetical protein